MDHDMERDMERNMGRDMGRYMELERVAVRSTGQQVTTVLSGRLNL